LNALRFDDEPFAGVARCYGGLPPLIVTMSSL
jgi:hypothetical protein